MNCEEQPGKVQELRQNEPLRGHSVQVKGDMSWMRIMIMEIKRRGRIWERVTGEKGQNWCLIETMHL